MFNSYTIPATTIVFNGFSQPGLKMFPFPNPKGRFIITVGGEGRGGEIKVFGGRQMGLCVF